MIIPSPSTFFYPWNIKWIDSKNFFFTLWIFSDKRYILNFLLKLFAIKFMTIKGKLLNFAHNEFLLLFYNLTNSGIVNGRMNEAFHHGSSLIIFDIAFPSLCRHTTIFAETLLSEIA